MRVNYLVLLFKLNYEVLNNQDMDYTPYSINKKMAGIISKSQQIKLTHTWVFIQ